MPISLRATALDHHATLGPVRDHVGRRLILCNDPLTTGGGLCCLRPGWTWFGIPPYPTLDTVGPLATITGITACECYPWPAYGGTVLGGPFLTNPRLANFLLDLNGTWNLEPWVVNGPGTEARSITNFGTWSADVFDGATCDAGTFITSVGGHFRLEAFFDPRNTAFTCPTGLGFELFVHDDGVAADVFSTQTSMGFFGTRWATVPLAYQECDIDARYDKLNGGTITIERGTSSIIKGACLPDDDGYWPDGTQWEP